MSLETFLDLTDEDVQMYVSTGHGAQPLNPFHGSVINKPNAKVVEEDYYNKDGIDYSPESDATDTSGPIDIQNPQDTDPSNL